MKYAVLKASMIEGEQFLVTGRVVAFFNELLFYVADGSIIEVVGPHTTPEAPNFIFKLVEGSMTTAVSTVAAGGQEIRVNLSGNHAYIELKP